MAYSLSCSIGACFGLVLSSALRLLGVSICPLNCQFGVSISIDNIFRPFVFFIIAHAINKCSARATHLLKNSYLFNSNTIQFAGGVGPCLPSLNFRGLIMSDLQNSADLDDESGDLGSSENELQIDNLSDLSEEKRLALKKYLGRRAAKRRRELKLNPEAIEFEMGLKPGVLAEWEEGGFPDERCDAELSWESMLQVPEGWLRSNERRRSVVTKDTPGLKRASDEPRAVSSTWSRRQSRAVARAASVAAKSQIRERAIADIAKATHVGERARLRRLSLGIDVKVLASALGFQAGMLMRMETRGWVQGSFQKEVEMEQLLRVPSGWFWDIGSPAPNDEVPPSPASTVDVEIARLSIWLSSSGIADIPSFKSSSLSPFEKDCAKNFAMRFGVFGSVYFLTEKEFQERAGITRALALVNCTRMASRYYEQDYPQNGWVVLNRIRGEIARHAPARVRVMEERLRPLLGKSLSLLDLNYFCRFMFDEPLFEVIDNPMLAASIIDPVILRQSDVAIKEASGVRPLALQQIRYSGVGNSYKIHDVILSRDGRDVDSEIVKKVVSFAPGFKWIDPGAGWYWLGPEKGRRSVMFRAATRIMALTKGPVDVQTIQLVFVREQSRLHPGRLNNPIYKAPTPDIVIHFLKQYSDFEFHAPSGFSLKERIDPMTILSPRDCHLYKVILDNGGICTRADFETALIKTGIWTPQELGLALYFNNFMMRTPTGHYAITRHGIPASFEPDAEDVAAYHKLSDSPVKRKRRTKKAKPDAVQEIIDALENSLPSTVHETPIVDGAGGFYCVGEYTPQLERSDVLVLPSAVPDDLFLPFYRSEPGDCELVCDRHPTGRRQIAGLLDVLDIIGVKLGERFYLQVPSHSSVMKVLRQIPA